MCFKGFSYKVSQHFSRCFLCPESLLCMCTEKQQQCSCNNQDRWWQCSLEISIISLFFSWCCIVRLVIEFQAEPQAAKNKQKEDSLSTHNIKNWSKIMLRYTCKRSLITIQSPCLWLSLHLSLPISLTQAVYQDPLLTMMKTGLFACQILCREWVRMLFSIYYLLSLCDGDGNLTEWEDQTLIRTCTQIRGLGKL